MTLGFEIACLLSITLVALMVVLQFMLMAFRASVILIKAGHQKPHGGKHRAETEETIRESTLSNLSSTGAPKHRITWKRWRTRAHKRLKREFGSKGWNWWFWSFFTMLQLVMYYMYFAARLVTWSIIPDGRNTEVDVGEAQQVAKRLA